MARSVRRRMRRIVMWMPVVVLVGGMTFAAEPGPKGDGLDPRVRSTNPVIASAIQAAQAGSETFRALVRTIEDTDGIVYVERGQCRHGVAACLSLSVHSGGGYRLLRILVDSVDDLVSLIATLAHELRHAIELLSEPAVKTAAAAYNFYLREAPT